MAVPPANGILACLVLAMCIARDAQAGNYSITELSGPGESTVAMALNNAGEVVGAVNFADGAQHAFLWQNSKGMIDLGVLAGDASSAALSINDSGMVVGTSQAVGGQPQQGFLWQLGTGMTNLGASAGLYTQAMRVNNNYQVTGIASSSADFGTGVFPFIFTPAQGIQPVEVPEVTVSRVGPINIYGQMAILSPDSVNVLFVSPGSVPVEIHGADTLAGGAALGMNDYGTVVGFIGQGNGLSNHGYVWNQATGLIDLGSGVASGVNNLNQAVGIRNIDGGGWTPYIFDAGMGTFEDLSTLIDDSGTSWSMLFPTAINDLGQIAGYGTFNGQTEAFLLTPNFGTGFDFSSVPEPATLGILAIAGLLMLRQRRE